MSQVAMIAGGTANVVGTLRQGKMNAQMAEYNAEVAKQNQAVVEQQAMENARRARIQTNKTIGAQRAGFAASGVSGGSALDIMEETAAMGALDEITIQNQGQLKRAALESEIVLERYRAKNELIGSYIGAVGAAAQSGSAMART